MSEIESLQKENANLRELMISMERRLKLMLKALEILNKDMPKQEQRITESEKKILSDLWEAYPKAGQDRSSKIKVVRSWANLSPKPSREELVKGFHKWKTSKKWAEGYVEGVSVWLSNRKWENDPEQENKKKKYQAI